jgi:hypothetical protein
VLGPLTVLLGQNAADEADLRCPIGRDADDVGAAADFPVQPFLGGCGTRSVARRLSGRW